jgi:hypothetical protein
MSGPNRSSDLRNKLSAIAVVLTSIGTTSAALTGNFGVLRWDMSNPSTVETDRPCTDVRTIDLALSEIRATRAILAIPDLADDRAFWMYVTAVDAALTSHETAETHATAQARNADLRNLAASLALARTAFQDQVATLSGWLAITEAVRPDAPRYAKVPSRFQRSGSVDLIETPQVSLSEIEMRFLIDQQLAS